MGVAVLLSKQHPDTLGKKAMLEKVQVEPVKALLKMRLKVGRELAVAIREPVTVEILHHPIVGMGFTNYLIACERVFSGFTHLVGGFTVRHRYATSMRHSKSVLSI